MYEIDTQVYDWVISNVKPLHIYNLTIFLLSHNNVYNTVYTIAVFRHFKVLVAICDYCKKA